MNTMDKLTLYGRIACIILVFTLIVLTIKNFKKLGNLRILTFIPAFGVLQIFFSIYVFTVTDYKTAHNLMNLSRNIFVIIELCTILYFYLLNTTFRPLKFILATLLTLIFVIVFFSIVNKTDPLSKFYSQFTSIEAIVILVICMIQYVQILQEETIQNIARSHLFIVTSGFFFFYSFTAPFYILYDYIDSLNFAVMDSLKLINDFAYIVLYIFFIKAFLCKINSRIYLA
jgi:hypothetical protein